MPQPISFPRDEQAHDATIEWWYWNGHLSDASGNRYSFTNCLFRANVAKAEIPFLKNLPLKSHVPHAYFAHAVLSDITKQKTIKDAQHVVLLSRESFTKPLLHISYRDPLALHDAPTVMEETAPFTPLEARTKSAAVASGDLPLTGFAYRITSKHLDLTLTSRKSPLLEAGTGYISVAGRESYYYSLTDLRITGFITLHGKRIAVEGKAWMDHQWANVAYARDRWNWFSFQLADGTDIMCVEYISGNDRSYLVDTIRANGTTEHGAKLTMTPGTEVWKSPKTHAVYPLSWEIAIPETDMRFNVHAAIPDQEVLLVGMNYWEGPVDVSGTIAGAPVKGAGFMELVGYPADYHLLTAITDEIKKQICRFVC